ncbi:hypothetical protein [Undibacterium fentianense]|uniref:Uncharacterized protein n=1 Tax=Undibacterium fentianense TaxID=2828728 RepID=A0A941ICU9_9BURK|nr:hypothetical protein [Undibacterium fentianense]MBR7799263.1 hypothetical protein [Undibacterium fentianense]
MIRKLIIAFCALGIAYYSIQINQLKDRISLSPNSASASTSALASTSNKTSPAQSKKREQMRFHFTMSSRDIQLIERCRQLFSENDQMVLGIDPKDSSTANLKVERIFQTQMMQEILDLNKALKSNGCMQKDSDVFEIKTN